MQSDPEPTPNAPWEGERRTLRTFIGKHWQPKPIQPPTVDPQLEELDGLQRSAEVFRYSILSVEWWLSPHGRLREWLRLNGKVSAVLLIPAVLVVPLVSFLLWHLAMWIALLLGIASNLITLPLAILVVAAVIAGVRALLRAILGR